MYRICIAQMHKERGIHASSMFSKMFLGHATIPDPPVQEILHDTSGNTGRMLTLHRTVPAREML